MATDEGFTHAEELLADGEMVGSDLLQPDPEPLKEEAEESGKGGAGAGADKLKVTLLISGAVVAVIGAVFAIAKKMKEATSTTQA